MKFRCGRGMIVFCFIITPKLLVDDVVRTKKKFKIFDPFSLNVCQVNRSFPRLYWPSENNFSSDLKIYELQTVNTIRILKIFFFPPAIFLSFEFMVYWHNRINCRVSFFIFRQQQFFFLLNIICLRPSPFAFKCWLWYPFKFRSHFSIIAFNLLWK